MDTFVPRKVTEIEVYNKLSIFNSSVITLLQENINDWFLIAEHIGDDYEKHARNYDSSSTYWKSLLLNKGIILQTQTRRLGKIKTAKLFARFVKEE